MLKNRSFLKKLARFARTSFIKFFRQDSEMPLRQGRPLWPYWPHQDFQTGLNKRLRTPDLSEKISSEMPLRGVLEQKRTQKSLFFGSLRSP